MKTSTPSAVVRIKPEWWDECRAIAVMPHHYYSNDAERLVKGLLAERAVVEYLLDLAPERSVQWLAAEPTPARMRGQAFTKRQHLGDILWCGQELDVKLTSTHQRKWLIVKAGAQHLNHVIVEWHRHLWSFRVLGVLTKHQPETFQAARPIVNPRNGEPFLYVSRGGTERPVNGWPIPHSRLQPLSTLVESQ